MHDILMAMHNTGSCKLLIYLFIIDFATWDTVRTFRITYSYIRITDLILIYDISWMHSLQWSFSIWAFNVCVIEAKEFAIRFLSVCLVCCMALLLQRTTADQVTCGCTMHINIHRMYCSRTIGMYWPVPFKCLPRLGRSERQLAKPFFFCLSF